MQIGQIGRVGRVGLTPAAGVGVRTLDTVGAELAVNGSFAAGITGWTDASSAGGAIAWASGALRTTNTLATARARQSVTVTAGKRYAFGAQNVGSPAVAGSFSLGSTVGGTDYLSRATNPAIAQRLGIAEFVATTTLVGVQLSAPIAGSVDWDNVTLRELISTKFKVGKVFSDDFSGDGPMLGRVLADGVPWRLIDNTNGTQVVPSTSGGKMVVTPNASGASAAYPYLDFGDGKAAGIVCDLSWTGAGSVAMIAAHKAGARLAISDIVRDAFHPTFTDTKLDIGTGTGAAVTVLETVTYASPVVTDGRIYAAVGWRLDGTTATFWLPDGTTIQRTDSRFVGGECAVVEHYYSTPPTGGVSIDKADIRLG